MPGLWAAIRNGRVVGYRRLSDIFVLISGNGCEMLVAHAAYLAYVAINDRIAGSFMFCGVTVTTST